MALLPDAGQRALLARLAQLFTADDRVDAMWVAGSLGNDTATSLSDIDLWLLFQEEAALRAFADDLTRIFEQAGALEGVTASTAHHWFVTYRSGIQVDLNMVSAATYCSLRAMPEQVLFDKTMLVRPLVATHVAQERLRIEDRLLVGWTSLARCTSKFLKDDYIVVTRFLDGVRNAVVLPLMPTIDSVDVPNRVSLRVEALSPVVRALFIRTYADPTADRCRDAIHACMELLDLVTDRTGAAPPLAVRDQVRSVILPISTL